MINYRLHLFELIFACLLIFAHLQFGFGDYLLDAFGRGTVVFFFILSSYFYNRTLNKDNYNYKKDTLNRSIRLLIIYIITFAIYVVVFVPIKIGLNGIPTGWNDFNKHYMPSTAFLWFLLALSLCYLIYPFIHRLKWIHSNKHMIIIPLFILLAVYILRIFAGKYDLGVLSDLHSTRNFIFTGIPCFLIGTYIYDHPDYFTKITPTKFYIAIVVLFVIAEAEAFVHLLVGTQTNEFYIGTLLIAIICFIYCIQNPECKLGFKLYKIFGSTGPTFIYLFHMIVVCLFYTFVSFRFVNVVVVVSAIVLALSLDVLCLFLKRRIVCIKHHYNQRKA